MKSYKFGLTRLGKTYQELLHKHLPGKKNLLCGGGRVVGGVKVVAFYAKIGEK